MVFVCCVKDCFNSTKKGFEMHRFPNNQEMCNIWLSAIGRLDMKEKPLEKICASYRVCGIHFGPEAVYVGSRYGSTIKADAVPTLLGNSIEMFQEHNLNQVDEQHNTNAVPIENPDFVGDQSTSKEGERSMTPSITARPPNQHMSTPAKISPEDIVIKGAGIFDTQEGDIAVIFYVTIENLSDKETGISVSMNKCFDQAHTSEGNSCDSIYIIGGYMGVLKSKHTMNATLIYPNMYTSFRQITCTVTVNYRFDKHDKIVTKIINFRTNNSADENYSGQNQCATIDLDSQDNCNRVDCVMKYSGERSYFNPATKECEHVPVCVSDPTNGIEIGYSWINNQCINLKDSIQPSDIELLDNNQADVTDDMSMYQTNQICHHGEIDSSNPECVCSSGWRTSLSGDDVYEPSLLLYHMCNVETGTWNCVNKTKIQTTILIISILVLTIASKVLIVMCILTWCYKHFTKNKDLVCTDDDYEKLLIQNPLEDNDKCICTDLKESVKCPGLYKQTVDISYYPGKKNSSKMTLEGSRTRANKEEEYSIHLDHSTSSSNDDDDTTENEDNIDESSEQKKVLKKGSVKIKSQPEEETGTTDYSIHLSNTTSSNRGLDPSDSTETEEYAVDLTKNEEPH